MENLTHDMRRLLRQWTAVEPEWRDSPPLSAKLPSYACNFLPDRQLSLLAIHDDSVDRVMEFGAGRFGSLYCMPACLGCRACIPARISIDGFRPSKSMRRTLRRNEDLQQEIAPIVLTREKFVLFERFITQQFGTKTEHLLTPQDRRKFYDSWHKTSTPGTQEIVYRLEDKVVAVSTVDFGERGLYSHYCYYNLQVPRRRLGIYTFLKEIEICRQNAWPYLYVGFLNLESPKLRYKLQFSALEVLLPDSGWTPIEDSGLLNES